MTEEQLEAIVSALGDIKELCKRMERNAKRGYYNTLSNNFEQMRESVSIVEQVVEAL